jgi:hypothetical protein
MDIPRGPLSELPLLDGNSTPLPQPSHSSTSIRNKSQLDSKDDDNSTTKRARMSKIEDDFIKSHDISARIRLLFPKEDVIGKVRHLLP